MRSWPARLLLVGLLAGYAGLAGCAGDRPPPRAPAPVPGLDAITPAPAGPSWAPQPRTLAGLRTVATAGPQGFALSTRHGTVSFLPGVNLGSTIPGHQPGELAITPDQYRRWLAAMGRLGVRVVRVYTIHPPAFYRELRRYDLAHPDAPIYLMQGVYLPDESYVRTQNLFDPVPSAAFSAELAHAAGAVHGDLRLAARPGHASGEWTSDVSPWTAGWIVGVEWDPVATSGNDRRNPAAPAVTGRYFASTPDATPTERWLAGKLDELAGALAGYGDAAPIAFANWPTTDPLPHPGEPLPNEDLVGVDANHVRPTAAWPAGTFASYHAYPYYPDFLRYQTDLATVRYQGRPDPYAGYLTALRQHYPTMPVLLTEFGVPSSIGVAHSGPLGRGQGGHSESGAMVIDAQLLRMARDLGLGGAFAFSWMDEWFKLTWNTVNHNLPADRRQLWSDALTNEQHFGLLAMDPADALDQGVRTVPGGVRYHTDEGYLYLDLDVGRPRPATVTVGLDSIPTLGGAPPAGSTDARADYAWVLNLAAGSGRVWVRDEADPQRLDLPGIDADRSPAQAGWRPFQQVVDRPLTVPTTGRQVPLEVFDAGVLREGTWDPDRPGYDSRATWHLDGTTLRLRIPWAMAGLSDPSSHHALVPAEPAHTVVIDGLGLSVSRAGQTSAVGTVTWSDWQRVAYRERVKAGLAAVRDALVDTAG